MKRIHLNHCDLKMFHANIYCVISMNGVACFIIYFQSFASFRSFGFEVMIIFNKLTLFELLYTRVSYAC